MNTEMIRSPLFTEMPSDSVKFTSALVALILSVSFVASIFVLEDRKSVWGFALDKQEPAEAEQEADAEAEAEEQNIEEIPMAPSPLQRMCCHGCCPLNESLETYYQRFPTYLLQDRVSYLTQERDRLERQYANAQADFQVAKERFATATQEYAHVMRTCEKLSEMAESRSIEENIQTHSIEDMYTMLAAVHHWKPFPYAPNGLYPYQKVLWEKALLKEIYSHGMERAV